MAKRAHQAIDGDALLAALRSIEDRCREHAVGLPKAEAAAGIWAGVLFRVAERAFVASLAEIGEVLDLPREITRVPATKPWVAGIANNRGTLLPIFDLQAFLFGSATQRNVRNRVLVVRQEEFPFGLLVGEVVGIRHFETSCRGEMPKIEPGLAALTVGSFRQGDELYPILSAVRLAEDPRFISAAA